MKQHTAVQVDANGDDIVMEGIRDSRSNWCNNCLLYTVFVLATVGVGVLFLPCLIAATCFCAKTWRLYLTRTDIHYDDGCQPNNTIGLSEIREIAVLPKTNTIFIYKKEGRVYTTSKGTQVDTHVVFVKFVTNCEDFVKAVKTEIARGQDVF